MRWDRGTASDEGTNITAHSADFDVESKKQQVLRTTAGFAACIENSRIFPGREKGLRAAENLAIFRAQS